MLQKFSAYRHTKPTLISLLLLSTLAACGGSSDSNNDSGETIATNTAPIANAGDDQNVFINSTVTLSGALSSDADGDTLGYSWSLSPFPPIV